MAQWNMLYDMYERRLKAELSDAGRARTHWRDSGRQPPLGEAALGATASAGTTALAPGRLASSSSGPTMRVCRS